MKDYIAKYFTPTILTIIVIYTLCKLLATGVYLLLDYNPLGWVLLAIDALICGLIIKYL